jgi:hypothetical protein
MSATKTSLDFSPYQPISSTFSILLHDCKIYARHARTLHLCRLIRHRFSHRTQAGPYYMCRRRDHIVHTIYAHLKTASVLGLTKMHLVLLLAANVRRKNQGCVIDIRGMFFTHIRFLVICPTLSPYSKSVLEVVRSLPDIFAALNRVAGFLWL